jgi:hypothetical protein
MWGAEESVRVHSVLVLKTTLAKFYSHWQLAYLHTVYVQTKFTDCLCEIHADLPLSH